MVAPKRALLSVFNKQGIVELARTLVGEGVSILSTGGTAQILEESGIPLRHISEYTLYPELMDGRVKTLHPKIYGGILARRDDAHHLSEVKSFDIGLIDLVCVNLYPFESVVEAGCTLDEAIENIDIGGPTLIRAAAKNFEGVIVLTDPADYEPVMRELKEEGKVSLDTRKRLAVKAFRGVADYDAKIDMYLSDVLGDERVMRLVFSQGRQLRYGENWHQKAELFTQHHSGECTLPAAAQLHGKQMSYNNYVDLDCALQSVREVARLFEGEVVVAVVKHNNPCGLATGTRLVDTLRAAWSGDAMSAFGSLICTNHPFDDEAAQFLKDKFVEAVLAPSFEEDALATLKAKSPNIRLLALPDDWTSISIEHTYRYILGGMLRQTRDTEQVAEWRCVSRRQFPEEKKQLAMFSWVVCKYTRSNAIVIAEEYSPHSFKVLSMGAGQPNRVDSIRRLAIPKAYDNLKSRYEGLDAEELEDKIEETLSECVLSSDAFFPFPDSIEAAARGHIQYIVSPGGSIRDDEVIAAADRLNVAMVFTGMRHFLH
ncbi:MAG: bifunctional phosphoribosylaminoimidazolecarboxamide formyltransferase/IMP cyclohydrolase [Methermicoccaceae archaeon]